MDVFVFPSETDAFGNVAQEANASGVPAIVTNQGGPKFIVEHNKTGFVAEGLDDFVRFTIELMDDPEKRQAMKEGAREHSRARSWDSVFDSVYEAYRECVALEAENKAAAAKK